MNALENLARKACHYKHCLSTDKEIDGLCCGKIVAAMQEAVATERAACAQVAREFSELDNEEPGCSTAFGEGQECCTDALAGAIEQRDPDATATWLDRLRAERDVALAMHCELWGPGTRAHELAPCEHCGGCLSAINLAVDVWGVDETEQAVEDAPMGCVACYRNITMTHLDCLLGHNLPAFKPCPVKQADL